MLKKIKCIKHTKITPIFLSVVIMFFITTNANAYPYFSGFAGGGFDFQSEKEDLAADIELDAFLAGQFDLSKSIIFRINLSISTENIIGDGFLSNTAALFNLDEASITYRGSQGALSHYLTLFIGSSDPIGSDLFLQRHFGVPSFSSKILTTTSGLSANQIYPLSGLGLSYIIQTQKNIATGLYFYYNKITETIDSSTIEDPVPDLGTPLSTSEIGSNTVSSSIITEITELEETSLNLDFRFAAAGDAVFADIAAGFSFPFDNTDDSGEDVILVIRKANLHAGFNLYMGSSYLSSILFQGGITKLELNPDDDEEIIALKDIYCLIEPRFVTNKVTFSFALFNIPTSISQKLFYISNPLGVNISVYSNNLSVQNRKAEIGALCNVSLPETTINIDFSLLELQISPFFSLEIGNGQFDAALKCNITGMTSFKNALMNACLSLGYQVGI